MIEFISFFVEAETGAHTARKVGGCDTTCGDACRKCGQGPFKSRSLVHVADDVLGHGGHGAGVHHGRGVIREAVVGCCVVVGHQRARRATISLAL